jgi:hypothetical protein
MNWRRLLSNMELPAPWVTQGHRTPEPFGIVPERPSLHEVTISHPSGFISQPSAERACLRETH